MAIEVAIADESPRDAGERDRLIREISERIKQSGCLDGQDLDGDDLAALVRKLGPRDPRGRSGTAADPEEPFA
jgi:hypothetical protein